MSEPIRYALLAAGILLILLLIFWLASMVVNDAARWLDGRSHERARRIERELVKTKKRLALVSQAQASLLDADAHEAAVAMILESYRRSKETSDETS